MAFLSNNNSASNSVSTTVDHLQLVKDTVAAGYQVFKLELNANPAKVLAAQAKARWMSTITALGGCGMMKLNTTTQRLFWEIENTIGKYDDQDRFIPDLDFALNLSYLQLEESEDDKAIKALFASKGKSCPPLSGAVLKELKLSAKAQRMYFQTNYSAKYAQLTFNDNGSLDEFVDTMKTEKGLLTVYFVMDKTHTKAIELDKRHQNEEGGAYKVFLEPSILHVMFEESKTVYTPKPRNVLSKARLQAGLAAALAVMAEEELNVDGNKTLADSFFEAIEIKQELSLAKIGTGKKAHLDAKKGLIAAVEAGNWDHGHEARLDYIAKRGLNTHYTMSDHNTLMASLRKQLIEKIGDAAQVLLSVPPVPAADQPSTSTNAIEQSVAMDEETEDDIVATPVAVSNPLDWLKEAEEQAEADDEFADVDL